MSRPLFTFRRCNEEVMPLTEHEQRLVEELNHQPRGEADPFRCATYAPYRHKSECPRCGALVAVLFYVSGAHEHVCARCYDQER